MATEVVVLDSAVTASVDSEVKVDSEVAVQDLEAEAAADTAV